MTSPSLVEILNVLFFSIPVTSLFNFISPPFVTPFSANAIVYSNGPTIPPVGAYKAPNMFSLKLGSFSKTSSLLNI